MSKERTLSELRQTKDSVYKHPITHKDFEFVTHRFTESKLVDYMVNCFEGISPSWDTGVLLDKVEDFVKNNKS
jgi:hypothetical protein